MAAPWSLDTSFLDLVLHVSSHFVPPELGGEGASLGALADICYSLGQACASTGLIYAMHQVKMGCLVRHRKNSPAIATTLSATTGVVGATVHDSSSLTGASAGMTRKPSSSAR